MSVVVAEDKLKDIDIKDLLEITKMCPYEYGCALCVMGTENSACYVVHRLDPAAYPYEDFSRIEKRIITYCIKR